MIPIDPATIPTITIRADGTQLDGEGRRRALWQAACPSGDAKVSTIYADLAATRIEDHLRLGRCSAAVAWRSALIRLTEQRLSPVGAR